MTRLPTIMVPLLAVAAFAATPLSVLAAASHLVISEIQIGDTDSVNNEYVELFNPTDLAVDLTNLRLQVGTSNLVSSLSGSLAANHYYLIARPSFTTIPVTPDAVYSASTSAITANSYLTLYAADHSTVLDRVGMGTAASFETAVAPAPSSTQNLHRTDPCTDTDNNAADFSLAVPSPQNSTSIHPCVTSVTPTTSPTPTSTSLPTPTATFTPLPTPSNTPTLTPSPTLPPTPTATPSTTPVPTTIPSPTFTPMPTPTPSPAPWPPAPQTFSAGWFTCTVAYQPQKIFNFTVYFPKISCFPTWGHHNNSKHDHTLD